MTSVDGTVPAAAAGSWQLGGRRVHRLGFGALRLLYGPDGRDADRSGAIRVLRRAVDLGVNHIDTAGFYFSARRSANELIATALSPYPDDLVITTKVGPARHPSGAWAEDSGPDALRGQVEENIRQLGLDRLDVVNLRLGRTQDRGTGSLAAQFTVLAELRDEGLIGELGISNIGPGHLDEALGIAPVVCVQNAYGLTTRRDDDALLQRCADRGIAFVPFQAIAGGDVPGSTDAVVAEVAAAHDATPAQVRLAWTLHRGRHVLAIPGTGRIDHLEDNVAAASLRLSDEDLISLATAR